MSNILTKITDLVLKDVIKNEVVLPSTYKEHFDNHARAMNVDLDYEDMVSKVTQDRLSQADEMVDKTHCTLDNLEKTTQIAQEAIEEKNLDKLDLVMQEIKSLQSSISDLQGELHTDTLTKLYNRKWMMQHIITPSGEFSHEGILIFIDLDKFKSINTIHGYVIGDKVLQYLATYLKSTLKGMDVIRYAGDEFIVINKGKNLQDAFKLMKTTQENLLSKKIKASNGELLYLAFSFGLTRFEPNSNFRDVLEIADSLMHENKKNKDTKS